MDYTQQNSKYMLSKDRDESINHIISEYNKLKQKQYKTKQQWEEKVIQWKFCQRLKFNHTI